MSVVFKKFLLLLFLFACSSYFPQIKLCSWNLENFGRSKHDSTIRFVAKTLKDFDLVAVVEVVAGNGGTQAVARLVDELDRTGTDWDYCVSDPTTGTPSRSERYAFLWKTSKLKRKGRAWLDQKFKNEIEREPYLADFLFNNKEVTVVAFHALPKEKQPEKEIQYFKFLPAEYPGKTLVFCGDFNCPQSSNVFNPLKNLSYKPALTAQKTSLKMECGAKGCLASEYDNLFYDSRKIKPTNAGVIHFYKKFSSLKSARSVSDHLPVFLEFSLN